MNETLLLESQARWEKLETLQNEYGEFSDFLYDCMTDLMGFNCSDIQQDIGDFLQYGPQYMMVQAQRSQAKSTIVAIFGVWCMLHDPTYRILIVSAGSDVAVEIANWVIQIIMNWEILECMRPDKTHGDRSSTKAFDIHWQLKGAEKSPSVACIGITANMQGRRADLLIPDDIESSKNGMTEIQRQNLQHLSKDFTSICSGKIDPETGDAPGGRICYMGTPQTSESIYNALPGRGYHIRVWPGRYPTVEQLDNYGEHLAPLLRERILADPSLQTGGGPMGDQGKPIDNMLLPEEALSKKELDQGPAYFQLQHMLNTRLLDKERHPLKLRDLITCRLGHDEAPGEFSWLPDPQKAISVQGQIQGFQAFYPFALSQELYTYEGRLMYIDPAGGGANGDETVCAISYFLHGYVVVKQVLALPGGYEDATFKTIADLALQHKVNKIDVEQNYGNGAFAQMLRPVLQEVYKAAGEPGSCTVADIHEAGQKELRIIDTLEPIMARHRLIVDEQVWVDDVDQVQKYPAERRTTYMLSHQLSKITRDRDALVHDDRLDALAGAVRPWVDMIAVDEQARMAAKATNEALQHTQQWLNGGSVEQRAAENVNSTGLPTVKRIKSLGRRSRRRR